MKHTNNMIHEDDLHIIKSSASYLHTIFFRPKTSPTATTTFLGNGLASHLGLRIHLASSVSQGKHGVPTLKPTVNAPEIRPKPLKGNSSEPSTDFQKRTVSFREGYPLLIWHISLCTSQLRNCTPHPKNSLPG